MRNLHVVAALSALSLVLAAPAFSADVQDTQKQLQKEKQDVREKRKELRKEVREQAAESNKKLQQMRKASTIIGTNVKNGQGETLAACRT